MRVAMQTFGSDGDIRPFIALGASLRQAGHEATLLAASIDNTDYTLPCTVVDIGYRRVPEEIHITQQRIREFAAMRNPVAALRETFHETFIPYVRQMYDEALALCEQSDVIVSHFSAYPAMAAARKVGIPHVSLCFWPGMIRSRHYPVDDPLLGPLLNPLLQHVVRRLFDRALHKDMAALWHDIGLEVPHHIIPNMWFSDCLTLVAASPTLWPAPGNWPSNVKQCGYLRFPEPATPEEPDHRLDRFIGAGPPPVYMTFGSQQQTRAYENMWLLIDAARMSGVRAVVQVTEQDTPRLGQQDHDLFLTRRTPHALAFRGCRAVVHHGGAGTLYTATATRSASLVVAHNDEQYSWGKRAQALRIGPPPLRRSRVTVRSLARSIREVAKNDSYRTTAERLAGRMQYERRSETDPVHLIESVVDATDRHRARLSGWPPLSHGESPRGPHLSRMQPSSTRVVRGQRARKRRCHTGRGAARCHPNLETGLHLRVRRVHWPTTPSSFMSNMRSSLGPMACPAPSSP
ncbi:MAG: hypothetical protein GF331_13115 [Chitinivibrionales bacterium]|nr:hypothetical protein [Chitinivibrionales bacterium]